MDCFDNLKKRHLDRIYADQASGESGTSLHEGHPSPGVQGMHSRRRTPPSVVMVFTKPLWPIEHGNQRRAQNVLRWLKDNGYRNILLMPGNENTPTEPVSQGQPLVDELIVVNPKDWKDRVWNKTHLHERDVKAEKALEFFRDRIWCSDAMRLAVSETCRRVAPLAVIANYIFMAPAFQGILDGTLRIIDTHDTFSRQAEKVSARGVEAPLACSPEIERNALLAADVIMAIQREEQSYLSGLVPERDVITVGISHDQPVRATPDVQEKTILFVGSSNHPNQDGIRYFLDGVWPLILERVPTAKLRVAGRICDVLDAANDGVELLGYCMDLGKVYAEAELVINATRVGTGLKVKSVEAIAHGKPLVAWPDGLEGLPRARDLPFSEADTEADFANAVIRILSDPPYRHTLEDNAYVYAREHFTSSAVFRGLQRMLDTWTMKGPRNDGNRQMQA